MNEVATDEIQISDFSKVDMRVGTILQSSINEGARKPAYILQIDFGDTLGLRTTSAQITDHYDCESLVGRQVIAVVNFPSIRIAGVKSEVLVLGVVGEAGVTLLSPDAPVVNGLRIA